MPLYLTLLFAVELHGGIGLYRLAIKWGWLEGRNPQQSRRRLAIVRHSISAFFITLGLVTLLPTSTSVAPMPTTPESATSRPRAFPP